eukprot:8593259-Pyramimonas_sp.AAC.1
MRYIPPPGEIDEELVAAHQSTPQTHFIGTLICRDANAPPFEWVASLSWIAWPGTVVQGAR